MRRVPIYLPDEIHEAVRIKAFVERISINRLVLRALEEMLRTSPPPELPAEFSALGGSAAAKRSKVTGKEKAMSEPTARQPTKRQKGGNP